MAVPKRDPKYQAQLMVESFGAERAYKMVSESCRNSTATLARWWHDVRNKIDYTPPPKERTPAELAYDRLVAWATEQGVEFYKNPYGFTITIKGEQPKFRQ